MKTRASLLGAFRTHPYPIPRQTKFTLALTSSWQTERFGVQLWSQRRKFKVGISRPLTENFGEINKSINQFICQQRQTSKQTIAEFRSLSVCPWSIESIGLPPLIIIIIIITTLGPLNASAVNFLSEVGRRLTSLSGYPRETRFCSSASQCLYSASTLLWSRTPFVSLTKTRTSSHHWYLLLAYSF